MKATASAHPNVALIKYWGKSEAPGNVPAVASLSLTLAALKTETEVEFDAGLATDELILNGEPQPAEHGRLSSCLDALRSIAGDTCRARIRSSNDFPTGAGLASSASGYAALVTAAAAALGIDSDEPRLHDAARIGSGSAPRSLHGGVVALRLNAGATSCEQLLAPDAWPLDVVVAVTTEAAKSVSSRDGMNSSRQTSPFYKNWLATHADDMRAAEAAIEARDFSRLAELAEHNCLKMHAVMHSSRPPLMYWSPTTVACLRVIADLRRDGVPVFFTIDAGPQVKAVCLPEAASNVADALGAVHGVQRLISGALGEGARVTS